MFNSKEKDINLVGTKMCTSTYGTSKFERDPCCNKFAAIHNCCRKHDGIISKLVLESVNEKLVLKCKSPTKITALLNDVVVSLDNAIDLK